jgi:hypothetical protein
MEKILIIDDEQDAHYSFKRLLDGAGDGKR